MDKLTAVARVLIIDDEPDGCEAVAGYLTKGGHTVRCVPNGREALSALVNEVPHAILLDVRMPGMDGLEVLEVVRSYLRWGTVPIAMLTAFPEDGRLAHVAQLGVNRIFAKSRVNLNELLTWVNEQARRPAPRQIEPPAPQVGA
jgi:CheY-like chemotaxis protein